MRTRPLAAGLGLLLLVAPAPAAHAEVTVGFVQPARYTDVGNYGYDAERNLQALERHLTALGSRCLKADETLELRILDVDLAGRNEWWRYGGAYDLRVMREITWPRGDLEYVWRGADGRILGEGKERVADMNYLRRSAYVRSAPDALPNEKAMLRDWLERRFCPDRLGW